MEKKNEAVADDIKAMNIYQRIAAVSNEVGRVQMTTNVETGNNKSYKALSISDVVDAVTPLMGKYRLAFVPSEKEILSEGQMELESKFGKKTQFYVRMKATYKLINIDKPDEYVEAVGFGDGIDTGDKCLGKAVTYSRKYCIIDIFNLSKGDDLDDEASPESGYTKVEAKPKKKAKSQSDMAIELNNLIRNLATVGVDVHDDIVSSYVKDKAQVPSVDGGYLLTDLNGMTRVIDVLRGIYEKKK